jgi:hypothetical protein
MTRRILLLALAIPAIAPAADAPARPPGITAGAFAQDVTPEHFPISVNGGFADRKAASAADKLHARCLALDDGKTKVALCVVDSCMIPRQVGDAARAEASKTTGIPAEHILISATHTHSAPTVAGVFGSEPGHASLRAGNRPSVYRRRPPAAPACPAAATRVPSGVFPGSPP